MLKIFILEILLTQFPWTRLRFPNFECNFTMYPCVRSQVDQVFIASSGTGSAWDSKISRYVKLFPIVGFLAMSRSGTIILLSSFLTCLILLQSKYSFACNFLNVCTNSLMFGIQTFIWLQINDIDPLVSIDFESLILKLKLIAYLFCTFYTSANQLASFYMRRP